ncbi:MAG: hypothetical protein Q4G59_12550, partial [Planctomycetia bacterium]|nr:hypothetical protein [Planctomycetia bacterium]
MSGKNLGIGVLFVVMSMCSFGFALPNKPIPQEAQVAPNQRLRLACVLPKEFPLSDKQVVRVLAIVRSDKKETDVMPIIQSEQLRLLTSTPQSCEMQPNRWYL